MHLTKVPLAGGVHPRNHMRTALAEVGQCHLGCGAQAVNGRRHHPLGGTLKEELQKIKSTAAAAVGQCHLGCGELAASGSKHLHLGGLLMVVAEEAVDGVVGRCDHHGCLGMEVVVPQQDGVQVVADLVQ